MSRPMPREKLPEIVLCRLQTFKSGCALARYINTAYIRRHTPPIWVEWAKRNLCWRHKPKR